MTVSELRALLRTALLAAPIAACHPSPSPPPDNHGSGSGSGSTTTASTCRHGELSNGGCGGAEVALPDGPEPCHLPKEGDVPIARCTELCGGMQVSGCNVFDRDGAPTVFCQSANPCMGRLASDGALERSAYADGVIHFLALARRMEAHSVGAFRELATDLARFGAPVELVEACRLAAEDEARHAAVIGELLVARGVALEPLVPAAPPGFASLRALAEHNEREGVVGETWGALVALHQAEHAADADVRTAMRAIADDESAHAALSFAIGAWARAQLPAGDLDRVRRAAVGRVAEARPADDAAVRLGWPSHTATAAMLDVVAAAL